MMECITSKILIVDDDEITLNFLYQIFKYKYSIEKVNSGIEAIEKIKYEEFDLIILDLNMPKLDGYETAKIIKSESKCKNIPILFLSATKNKDNLLMCLEAGAKDFIFKPFDVDQLRLKVRNHIESYRYKKESLEQKMIIEEILNKQSNLVVLIKSNQVVFMNNSFLNFFDCESIDDFIIKFGTVFNTFTKEESIFKNIEEENWLDKFSDFPKEKRVVSIKSSENQINYFRVNIDKFNQNSLITLTDVSESFNHQLKLENQIKYDHLTNAYSRSYFEVNINDIVKENHENGFYTSITLFDIDKFKIINDNFGHDVGDSVLKELIVVMKQNLRMEDFIVRYGGDEFILIIKIKDKERVFNILENLRKVIQSHKFNYVNNVACSFGSTIHNVNNEIANTLKIADNALYTSKAAGRNYVTVL